MEISVNRSRLIWIAVAILAGLALLTAGSTLWASGDSGSSAEGGGDNPVVGSLPCVVDPDMDLKFFKALGRSPSSGTIVRPRPTLALAGASLPRYVTNAWGNGGSVNRGGSSWSLLGLLQTGGMVTTRGAVLTGAASVWNWLPPSYLGGRITMVSNIGSWNASVTEACQPLPAAWLCALPMQPAVDAVFTVTGPTPGVPVVKYRVTIVADVVTVQFL